MVGDFHFIITNEMRYPMNLFAKIKNTVTVKQAAELYGLQE